jgi:prepilin-type N-terminal cleavage/methylation domain-containing protein
VKIRRCLRRTFTLRGLIPSDSSGFTVAELVVTICILGILAAIAIPGFSQWTPTMNLKSDVRNLKADIELSRLQAIKENEHIGLSFDTANNQYMVFVDNGDGAGGIARDGIHNGTERVLKTVTIADGVILYEASFAGGAPQFRFDGRGIPVGLDGTVGNDYVHMRNNKGLYRGISLSLLGHAQIEESTDAGANWNEVDYGRR